MSKKTFRKCRYGQILGAALLLAAVQLPVACIDDSYDLDKVDLTMGLGSEGLSVTFGNTEKIMLGDILELDKSVKLDDSNLFYFVKSGTTSVDFDIDEAGGEMPNSDVRADRPVIDYGSMSSWLSNAGYPVSGGSSLTVPASYAQNVGFDGSGISGVKFNDVPVDITFVNTLYWKSGATVSVRLMLDKTAGMQNATVRAIRDFKITLPSIFKVAEISDGWTVSGNVLRCASMNVREGQEICRVRIDRLEANRAPVGEALNFTDEELTILASGRMDMAANRSFTMNSGDEVNARLVVGNEGQRIAASKVSGKVNPEISPDDVDIDISSGLPEFLQDDEVYLSPTNTTLKFKGDLTSIPADLNMSALLSATKQGLPGYPKSVNLPSTLMSAAKVDTAYYHRGESPYDPEGVAASAAKFQVEELSTLFGKLPDALVIKLDGGRITVPANTYTVELGHNYRADVEYDILLPFEFESGLTIVYKDSTESMNDDLKDYSAEGLRLNATAQNTIPLKLTATISAEDVNGDEIPGITFTTAEIAAAEGEAPKETEIVIEGSLSDPDLLRKVDRFKFHVKAADGESATTHRLLSTQYLRLANVKLRLKGQVTADFN